ncbi:putative retrotransposon hot spot protein (RHS) [Trypanosoma cruzi]|uniref:Putative retrotransposon hot spot protein (RHS) n=1 Tax=Trypanosoma cruzi TaxID=5693 RepID=A0A2V2W9Y6_TRYCR|nr:putative retrotransposon hot spot protein (RHS) [Trypanosoma cruzi]
MRLSDFLWNYVGGRAAVMKDYNVTMQAFVQEPDDYVQDQRLLEEIRNVTAHQAWRPLLGLFTKVCSLSGNVGTMNERIRSPLLQGENKRGTHAVTTEARREAAERLRGTQGMKFTICTNIEDVPFKGRARVNKMRLSDFLTMELGGRGVVDTNRDVLPEEFFRDPTKYIRDKGALNEMQASGHYLSMR